MCQSLQQGIVLSTEEPTPISSCTQMLVCSILALYSHESCPAALCDDPIDIDNGTVTFNGNSIGDMATYTCELSFELIGDANMTCTPIDIDRAEFQPTPPSCRREYTE